MKRCSAVAVSLSAVLSLLAIVSADASPDDIFDGSNCYVLPADALDGLVLAPDTPGPLPATVNTFGIRTQSDSPIANAIVRVELAPRNPVCPSVVLTGVTDALGEVVLTLAGGGCSHDQALSGVVKANGLSIRHYENVKSPDYDGAGGDLVVNLSDLVVFSAEFLGSDPAGCHDYDNNGATNLGDLVIFSPAFVNPNHCE